MRGAQIGCGFFAQNRLNAWRDLSGEGIELAAVCDRDRGRAKTAARAFGVPSAYDGREAETSGLDNLKTFALVEAAYEAAASGRAVAPLEFESN